MLPRQKLHFPDGQVRWFGWPCSQVNVDQYLGCWLYVNTAQTGAAQTQPKASLSSKLSNHHFPSSRPRRLVSQGLCVCISATLFWAFMPHTISKPPLSLSHSLSLSFCTHQRDSNALCIMDGGGENKQNVPVIYMTREITAQERLKWSNKARGHKWGGGDFFLKKQKRSHVS